MRRSLPLLILLALLLAAFLAVVWSFRLTGEPWQLTFVGEGGQLRLAIACEKPPIPKTEVLFNKLDLRNPVQGQVIITAPDVPLPLGQITFADLTTLPGRVTISLFEQEIDIMQRGLIINQIEHEWGKPITLQPS
ncbi:MULTISPECIES: hypothetical protein [unclassified Leptolyngbya]|uniref:hypothetical protein n=1 Tax=unclassified Leptolyngbya TaxID=2650499 RepID=UPI001685C462|nr:MULTISPECIES: hypothetical protein [unclassified Leptolyngbya]MBD1913415.1 hypothetical protein [Leptolyngbya sp. FACHB-8]MBD2155810.1 hypothetical protein [Leptolyngbya sp. FACHB-16]